MASLDVRRARRGPERSWPAYAVVGVVAAIYGPALDRYFTSEDFLLLRVLGERPLGQLYPRRELLWWVVAEAGLAVTS